jgi:cell division protein FtsL
MATHHSTVRYASRSAVSGSNAYDLARIRDYSAAPREIERVPVKMPETRPGTAPVRTPKAAPGTETGTAPRTRRKAQKSYGVSLYAAVGFLFAAVLMVFVLLAQVRYAEVTNDTVKLQKQMTQLTEDERKLRIAYEDAFDVNQVEQYATHQLGMSKPAESQLGTISASAQDKAVVSDTQDDGAKGESMATFLASLIAYFK